MLTTIKGNLLLKYGRPLEMLCEMHLRTILLREEREIFICHCLSPIGQEWP